MTAKTTRYGLSVKAGYWDTYGDSDTDAWQGCFGNTLHTSSCALTVSVEAQLVADVPKTHPALLRDQNGQVIPGRLKPHSLLKIVWPGTHLVQWRSFDDRAPEADPRCDLFFPWKDDPTIPDEGQVTLA